ncbi:MAG: bifunctional DNA-binding transcriptional regulator/O6-methylguanine-DNA methyltransferase Ada [Rhodospirillales bacterium]
MDDERRWEAVSARDPAYDGRFVYAVRSTGVYCKPSCPARRPGRDQVRYFDAPDAAERAGFRPCRRCHPRDVNNTEAALVEAACRALEAGGTPADCGVGPRRLTKAFLRQLGVTPRQYADALRLESFKAQVRKGGEVTEALYEAGYGSSSRLYERAGAQLGMTPGTYRKGGRGMRIAFAIADCPLGRLLVAATQRGVCAVALADSDEELEAALAGEFPEAELRRDDEQVGSWTRAVVEHLEGARPALDLPLDIRATAFQRRVWEELRRIPRGETRTYQEVARAIGRPTAARAVARACATNPVALAIPCHRVVRGDGGEGGYRWGVARKRALLKSEAECSRES